MFLLPVIMGSILWVLFRIGHTIFGSKTGHHYRWAYSIKLVIMNVLLEIFEEWQVSTNRIWQQNWIS